MALPWAVVSTTGCFRYVAVAPEVVPTDRELRTELTDAASRSLAPRLGEDVIAVNGRVHAYDTTSVVIAVTGTVQRSGVEQEWRGERVTLAREQVARLSERRFDRRRSLLLGAVLVGGAAALAVAIGTDFLLNGTGRGQTSPSR
jgi:hypothetical protein